MHFRLTGGALFAAMIALAQPLAAEQHAAEAEGEDMASEEMASDASAETVVATVNGTEITLGHMIVLRQRLPQQYAQVPPEQLFSGILDQLVQQTLLGEGVELTPGGVYTLDNEGRALRAAQVLQGIAAEATTVEAIEALYEERYANAEPEQEYNASHILVETEDEAAALIEELNGGADFAELAREKSTGPSGPNGGELGWFGKGAMVAPFEAAVVAMEPGDISEPVETQFGWHVVKLNEVRDAAAPELAQVQAELADEIQRTAIEARIEDLLSGAEVDRSVADGIDPALINNIGLLE